MARVERGNFYSGGPNNDLDTHTCRTHTHTHSESIPHHLTSRNTPGTLSDTRSDLCNAPVHPFTRPTRIPRCMDS